MFDAFVTPSLRHQHFFGCLLLPYLRNYARMNSHFLHHGWSLGIHCLYGVALQCLVFIAIMAVSLSMKDFEVCLLVQPKRIKGNNGVMRKMGQSLQKFNWRPRGWNRRMKLVKCRMHVILPPTMKISRAEDCDGFHQRERITLAWRR